MQADSSGSTVPTFTQENTKKEGLLQKKSAGVAGVWQKRWHLINTQGMLGWWKESNPPSPGTPPRGFVSLRNYIYRIDN